MRSGWWVVLVVLVASGCAGVNNRQLKKIGYGKDNLAYFTGDGGVVLYKKTLTTQVFIESPCLLFDTRTTNAIQRVFDCGAKPVNGNSVARILAALNDPDAKSAAVTSLVEALEKTGPAPSREMMAEAATAMSAAPTATETTTEKTKKTTTTSEDGVVTETTVVSPRTPTAKEKKVGASVGHVWVTLPLPAGSYFLDRDMNGKISRHGDALFAKRFDDGLVCVMPPVQAARTSEAAGGGSAKVGVTGAGSGEAAGYGSSAIGVQQLFEHSQSAWFLQVALYRLCEARLNGMIDEDQYALMYAEVFKGTIDKLGEEFESQESTARAEAAIQGAVGMLRATETQLDEAKSDEERKAILTKLASIRQSLDTRILAAVLGREIPEGELDEADALSKVLSLEFDATLSDGNKAEPEPEEATPPAETNPDPE